MNKIKYIGYFDTNENSAENRNFTLSATNKMTYIISVLNKIGYNVEIISASETRNKRGCSGKTVKISEAETLKLFRTFRWGNKINKFISVYSMKIIMFFHLMMNIQRNDTVIVYHSLAYINTFKLLKKIKKFNLILEVEEIYADVVNSDKYRKKEYKYFKYADAYIFPTELLHDKINADNKPYTIIYGTYQVEPDRDCKFNDGKIHCVYAGIFDMKKSGSVVAVSEFLDENYQIHIIGFGTDKDKNILLKNIKESSRKSDCVITFDGLKTGEEYIKYIQSCDIGLSTQNSNAMYNNTSFPSKVLSYMANGLRVVSVKIQTLEASAINDYLYYYESDNPQKIAEAVKNVNLNDKYDSREIISELDIHFTQNIKILLEKFGD